MRTLFFLQFTVPLALIAWLALAPARRGARLWAQLSATGLVLIAMSLTGLWLVPPWWWPRVCLALFVPAAILAWRRRIAPGSRPATRTQGILTAAFALSGLIAAWHSVAAMRGREPPPIAHVNLDFPLRGGTFLVASGGSDIRVNAHLKTRDSTHPRLARWRGNGYAIDVVAIDRLGRRARGVLPGDDRAYRTFGWPVLAPCSGRVVFAVDGRRDLPPPHVDDQDHLAGNHVLLECAGVHVVLAHLRRGSVRVSEGDAIQAGQVLGNAGNSGVSNEPHLHIHAQKPGTADAPMSGEPVPILFGGRFLVRGDRVTVDRHENPDSGGQP